MYRKIISDNLKYVFPNVEIALGVFMCMMVTKCAYAGEQSLSRLKAQWSSKFELTLTHVHGKPLTSIIKQCSAKNFRKCLLNT